MLHSRVVRNALLTVAIALLTRTAPAAEFGTYCQEAFENGWAVELRYAYRTCRRFNEELEETDTRLFYHNLEGARWRFETDNDQNGLERVHLAFVLTHGGRDLDGDQKAVWAMWDEWVDANSWNMRLGNEGRGLSIFASYACETHTVGDGHAWERWRNPFKGGLRYTVGSHGNLATGLPTDECGQEFADNLQDGDVIYEAWRKAVREPSVDQDATAIASGYDAPDCYNRRDNMTWQNFSSYPRRRDDNMNFICWWSWNDL